MVPFFAPPPIETGWMVFWDDDSSLTTFEQHASLLKEVMVEWTGVEKDGTVVREAGTKTQRARLFKAAHNSHTLVFGTASNFGQYDFDPKRMSAFLEDPAKRTAHAKKLVGVAKSDGLNGIDLDYESMAAKDRDLYSAFVAQLAGLLHKSGLLLSVTVHAKTSEPGDWGGAIAEDWKALGASGDVVRVMTYDQHYSTSKAGPIAADDWVLRVMQFAKRMIPAEKLDMGIAAYGYDWTVKPALSLTWSDFYPQHTGTLDPASHELVDGKVRFSGAAAYAYKRTMAQQLGLRGTGFWYIGSGEPAMWTR
ncbi:hypothetical protein BH11ARM2_BH11ARM2_24590 [soil metagenome]